MADIMITDVIFPPGAVRGITQSLEPISASSQIERTVNGKALDVSAPQFRKYRSTVRCTDQQAPSLDGIWPGKTVIVDCIAELSHKPADPPSRPVVEILREEYGLIFYRPRLTMLVVNYTLDKDEWDAIVGWTIELVEE